MNLSLLLGQPLKSRRWPDPFSPISGVPSNYGRIFAAAAHVAGTVQCGSCRDNDRRVNCPTGDRVGVRYGGCRSALRRAMDRAGNSSARTATGSSFLARRGRPCDRRIGDIRAGYCGCVVAASDYPCTGAARTECPDKRLAAGVQRLAAVDRVASRDAGTRRSGQARAAYEDRAADLARLDWHVRHAFVHR